MALAMLTAIYRRSRVEAPAEIPIPVFRLRHCVVVRGDRILAVCSVEEATEAGLAVEQHRGCLLPGLIDAHAS